MAKIEKKKNFWKGLQQVLLDYSTVSTFGGVSYFSRDLSHFGKVYWTVSIMVLCSTATYWSSQNYFDWITRPVQTVSKTTAAPLHLLKFPGLVICSPGNVYTFHAAAYIRELQNYLNNKNNNNRNFKMNPYEASIFNSVADIETILKRLSELNYLYKPLTDYFKMVGWDRTWNGTDDNKFYDFYRKQNIFRIVVPFHTLIDTQPVIKYYAGIISMHMNNLMNSPFILNGIEYNLNNTIFFSYFLDHVLKRWNSNNFYNMIGIDALQAIMGTTRASFDIRSQLLQYMLPFLMYTRNPCFDLRNLTGNHNFNSGLIKNCYYKNVEVPCSSIFNSVLTDRGICCAFQLPNAEKLYLSSSYSRIIDKVNDDNRENAYENTSHLSWFDQKKEPISRSGLKMGLEITLDSHQNQQDQMAGESNFESFSLLIMDPNDFPLTYLKGFPLRKGANNLIQMRGTIIESDNSIGSIDPSLRQCLFPDEKKLIYFKKYSQMNCLYENSLLHTQEYTKTILSKNYTCIPYNLPFIPNIDILCGSIEAYYFKKNFGVHESKKSIEKCLPDCSYSIYSYKVSHEPIRECDDINFGKTSLCSPKKRIPYYSPILYSDEIITKFNHSYLGEVIKNNLSSRYRVYKMMMPRNIVQIFPEAWKVPYDSYQRDICIARFYYEINAIWIFVIQPSSTIFIYLGNVGGLFGLLIGATFASIIELVWLAIKIFAHSTEQN